MTDFCPDGYLPTRDAIVRASECWFPNKIAALKTAAAPESQAKSDNNIEAAVRAFSLPQVPDAWRHAFEKIASQTVHRLRNFLHQGTLKAYYFTDNGRHSVSREFWATAHARRCDGIGNPLAVRQANPLVRVATKSCAVPAAIGTGSAAERTAR